MMTTVQGKEYPLLQPDWRTQMPETFELTTRLVPSTKKWELSKLFPSLKTIAAGQVTVKVTDCTYPGTKKPLRILSFFLNTAGQNQISISFVKLILAALNDQAVDWPEEFYLELREEVIKLHHKHSQTIVKVIRTTLGPHLTLMIKAAGAMNLQHEVEACFRMAKPFCTPNPNIQPKRRRHTKPTIPPPTLHTTVRVVQPEADQKGASTSAPPPTSETPCFLVLKTEEPWQTLEAIPNIIEQVKQVHMRLENLLTTLSSKAPPKLLRTLNSQFYRIQRQTILQEDTQLADTTHTLRTEVLKSQSVQLERLEKRLAEAEELNHIYIDNSFEMEEEVARQKTEAQSLAQKDQENLAKLHSLKEIHSQQSEAKDKLVATLQDQIHKLKEEATTYNKRAKKLHKIRQQEKEELGRLRTENEALRATKVGKEPTYIPKSDRKSSQASKWPIDRI